MKRTVAIIGAGKVGSVLAKSLSQRGYQLTGIASRTFQSADKLAREVGAKATVKAADITSDAEIILIATPDRCISQVIHNLIMDGGLRAGQFVFHTSGGVEVEMLNPAKKLGAFIGGIHPLQSFADTQGFIENLAGIYFALGGDQEAVNVAEEMVSEFVGKSFIISDKDRPLYHGAACIVSNYFVSLMHWAAGIYAEFGLSPQQAADALMPLVEGTIKNIQQLGPRDALTGPISRGDAGTIAAHLAGLENENEKKLYAQLGLYTLGVALEKGTVSDEQAKAVRQLLTSRQERVS